MRLDDRDLAIRASISIGAARLFVDYPRACAELQTTLEQAKKLRDGGAAAADAYVMLGSGPGDLYDFPIADRFLAEGVAFARAHDLDRVAAYMEAWQGVTRLSLRGGTALADGDETAQRASLTILDRLGARPLAERVRKAMRSAGLRAVPRGPQAATRENPAGLTAREIEVLSLLAEGRRNGQIAVALARSARTIEHHVESILSKLAVETRGEAVSAARRLGFIS